MMPDKLKIWVYGGKKYLPTIEFNPNDIFDINYFDALSSIVTQKYQEITKTKNVPQMQFCHMHSFDTKNDFFYIPMLLIPYTKENFAKWKTITKRLEQYNLKYIIQDEYIYISPFHQWEEVEFWERNEELCKICRIEPSTI